MASSKLLQLRTKAVEVSKLINNNYKQVMEKNKEYVQDPPTIETCTTLAKRLFYTRLASIPNRYEILQSEVREVKKLFMNNIKELTMDDYALIALFGVECYAWSWLGEVVGRGFTVTGYQV